MVLSSAVGRRIFHCGNLALLKTQGDKQTLSLPGMADLRQSFFKMGKNSVFMILLYAAHNYSVGVENNTKTFD